MHLIIIKNKLKKVPSVVTVTVLFYKYCPDGIS